MALSAMASHAWQRAGDWHNSQAAPSHEAMPLVAEGWALDHAWPENGLLGLNSG